MVDPVDEALALVEHITAGATVDPVSALLVLGGTVLLLVSIGVLGWLTLGAVLDAVGDAVP